jgi:hypothetical protein
MVLHQDIDLFDEFLKYLFTRGRPGVEGDAELAGIEIGKKAASLDARSVSGKGFSSPGFVPQTRRLDLDYLGAEFRQELGAIGSRNKIPEFQHPDIG